MGEGVLAYAEKLKIGIAIERSFPQELPLATPLSDAVVADKTTGSADYLEAMLSFELCKLAAYKTRGAAFQTCLAMVRMYKRAIAAAMEPAEAADDPMQEEEPVDAAAMGIVYFIRSGEYIKIGFTKNMAGRLAAMETLSPVSPVVLHQEPGTVADERAYHRHFAAQHLRREWFRHEGELAEYLARMASDAKG